MLAPHEVLSHCTLISLVSFIFYVNREARAGERPSRETERRAGRRPPPPAPRRRAPPRRVVGREIFAVFSERSFIELTSLLYRVSFDISEHKPTHHSNEEDVDAPLQELLPLPQWQPARPHTHGDADGHGRGVDRGC